MWYYWRYIISYYLMLVHFILCYIYFHIILVCIKRSWWACLVHRGSFASMLRCKEGGINQGRCGPNFLEIVGFSEILMLRRKIFGLLLLVKMKGSNFIGESLNMAHPTLQVPRRPWYQIKRDNSLHRGRGQKQKHCPLRSI